MLGWRFVIILKTWNELSDNMKNEKVHNYYDLLNKRKLNLFFKRIIDIIISLVFIVLFAPIIIVVAIIIKCTSSGPVFFKQERVTTYGRKFKIFKFRTMVDGADKKGALVTQWNDPRITKIGVILRKFRIDEIPQLFNILLGHMSFVGTRPEVQKYVDQYNDEMKATLLMPAGLTSMASIKFKSESEFLSGHENIDEIYINEILPKKMSYNLEYIEHFSVFMDFYIMLKTFLNVFGIQKYS